MNILYLPFLLQGFVMFADEFIFHERRGLPKWERWGHPLDTLSVISTFVYLLYISFHLSAYIGLCIFSCLLITKDEFIHAEKCSRGEHLLHALLFILHPISFLSAYLLFEQGDLWLIRVQFFTMLFFLFYQIFRWSKPWQILLR